MRADSENRTKSKEALHEAKLELKKSKRKNWYKILDVEKDSGDYDIKRAYRKKALRWHPDKWSSCSEEEQKDAEAQFKDINEAFTVLSDPEKRQRFDTGADIEDFGGMGGMGGVDPSQVFEMFFNSGGMGGMGGHGHGGGHHSFRFG